MVSCPIALYPAVAKMERISFRQVNRRTGNRLRQQLVDAATGEMVSSREKARGYEVGENQFLLVGDDELEAAEQEARRKPYGPAPVALADEFDNPSQAPIARPLHPPTASASPSAPLTRPAADSLSADSPPTAPDLDEVAPRPIENNRTIEIDRFIPRTQVDTRYLDTPYYVVPREQIGEEAFAVIRDAMRRKNVVGMGRIVLSRRERPIILEPLADGIRGTTLRYSHEIRDAQDYFSTIPNLRLPKEMLRVAEHIVEGKTTDFDPTFLEDRYRTVLISKLKHKTSELGKPRGTKPPSDNVIRLMDVLKRSLAAERPTGHTPKRAAASRRIAGLKSSSTKRTRDRQRG